jgi:aminoglycoside/choline kinase family phosphotransferase
MSLPGGDDELSREIFAAALAARGLELTDWQPLSGDVSPRRYVRVALGPQEGGARAILALYPPEIRGTCTRFQATDALLAAAGVRGPAILGVDCDGGWMLLEDAGPQTLAEADLGWEARLPFYEEALRLADRIAGLPAERVAAINPALDGEVLLRELRQTWDLFLVPGGWADLAELAEPLWQLFMKICATLAAEPPVPCHRDYMARNLMPSGEPGHPLIVLDHQDLRLGPPAYDLASLLNDTLFPPPELEDRLLARAGWDTPEKRLRYHRTAAQRSLKAVGTYVSFAKRGALRHLPLVAPTLRRALAHLALLPEARPLLPALSALWEARLPALAGGGALAPAIC